MSGGVTAATVATYATAAAAGLSAVASVKSMSAGKGGAGAPAVQEAITPPQAAKNPEIDPLKKKNANAAAVGPLAGPSSTMLTGVGGVDPSSLSLGKTTLLGG